MLIPHFTTGTPL